MNLLFTIVIATVVSVQGGTFSMAPHAWAGRWDASPPSRPLAATLRLWPYIVVEVRGTSVWLTFGENSKPVEATVYESPVGAGAVAILQRVLPTGARQTVVLRPISSNEMQCEVMMEFEGRADGERGNRHYFVQSYQRRRK